MATRPIRVWNGSEWEDVAIAPYDSGEFLTTSAASATYLPISASATLGGGGYAKSFLLGGM